MPLSLAKDGDAASGWGAPASWLQHGKHSVKQKLNYSCAGLR